MMWSHSVISGPVRQELSPLDRLYDLGLTRMIIISPCFFIFVYKLAVLFYLLQSCFVKILLRWLSYKMLNKIYIFILTKCCYNFVFYHLHITKNWLKYGRTWLNGKSELRKPFGFGGVLLYVCSLMDQVQNQS